MLGFHFIRRHQKLVWGIVIVITVVAFVFAFNPAAKNGGAGGGKYNLGSIEGQTVTLPDYQSAAAEVALFYYFNHGAWADQDPNARQSGFDPQRETYFRLFLIKRMHDMDIHVGEAAVSRLAAQILASLNRNGATMSPAEFEKQLLQPRRLTLVNFKSFLKHEIGIREMAGVIGLSGELTPPQEAAMLYRRENEEIATEAVFFNASNYLASVTVTPAALATFYTNELANYRIRDRRQVSYVKFPVSDFAAEADRQIAGITNFNDIVEATYEQRSTVFTNMTKEVALQKIRTEIHQEIALRAARSQAVEFADELLTNNPVKPEQLAQLAAAKKMRVGITSPFDDTTGPVELDVPFDFTTAAFKLTADDPVGGPIKADDGIYIIALNKELPSEIPPLDQIKDKVAADYRMMTAIQMARQAGAAFETALTNGVAAGKTFAAVAAADKCAVTKIPPFSLLTRSVPELEEHVSLGRLQQTVFALPNGAHSGLIFTSDGGMVVHVLNRIPADETKMQATLPAFETQVRRTRQNEAFNAWFSHEASVALRDTPINQSTAPDNGQP
jgi:hypothetical protein